MSAARKKAEFRLKKALDSARGAPASSDAPLELAPIKGGPLMTADYGEIAGGYGERWPVDDGSSR